MERIRRCIKISSWTIVVSAVVMNTTLNLVSEPILFLFAPNNPEVVKFAQIKLLVNSSFYFAGHLESLYGSAMRAMGKSTLPMIVSVGGICGVRVLWINTVFVWIRHPLTIFFAYAASWSITAIVQFILYLRLQKKLGRQWETEKQKNEMAKAVS